MMLKEANDILFAARQAGIDVLLKDGKLQLRVSRGSTPNPALAEEIKKNKDSIMQLLGDGKWKAERVDKAASSILPGDRSKGYIPLSYEQERLWMVDRKEGSVAYHSSVVMRVGDGEDVELLERSIRGVIDRHEVLRTVIREEEGRGYQEVLERGSWRMSRSEWGGYRALSGEVRGYVEQLISRPFDLSADHPLRAELVRTGEGDVLVVVLHHIASDAWSMGVLVDELRELYGSYREGRVPELRELEVQYGDYAIWQRRELSGRKLEEKLGYWRRQLSGSGGDVLPADRQGVGGGAAGQRVSRRLEAEWTEGLRAVSRQEGLSLYMTLLGALKILLYRRSGQGDIRIGSSIAGRQQQEVAGLIGFFANTLVLRSEVEGGMAVRDFLRGVRRMTLEAYEHQEVPYGKVVEAVLRDRGGDRQGLFQVMFVLENTGSKEGDVGAAGVEGLGVGMLELGVVRAKFDVTVSITELRGGLQVELTYRRDKYGQLGMERLLDQYITVLQGLRGKLERRIEEVEVMDGRERDQVRDWSRSKGRGPKGRTVTELFEEQAARTPAAEALVDGRQRLSYRELDERSNQVGHYLRSQGVGSEVLVGLCMGRGVDQLVGLLGIWKAGGAYVAIDPSNPDERIGYILEDVGGGVVVCEAGMGPRLSELSRGKGWKVLELQGGGEGLEGYGKGKVDRGGREDRGGAAAYVLYTSGTTGRPKGVVIEQGNIVDYVYGLQEELGLWKYRRFGLVSTVSADLGNTMLYSAWLSGGTLHVLSEREAQDGELLWRYCEREGIDCIKIVPSHWEALRGGRRGEVPLRLVVFGGERLSVGVSMELLGGGCEVVNHYGPTETTIGKLAHKVDREVEYGVVMPVGRPFGETEVYVLDGERRLCGIGCSGELYIGGAGVGRGYLNRPELTAERFVSNEYGEGRLYRTGDKGRWQAEGNIEFLGRVDEQVKIRGYRVEPGEVEELLKGCPGVGQVVVLAEREGEEVKGLVGYVVATEGYEREEVRGWLLRRLPEYMVPGRLVEVEEIPLTANGKVDRAALGRQGGLLLEGRGYAAPEGELERKMAGIWSAMLGVDRVGRGDNFFELGGHSLVAIRVVSAVRQELGLELSVGELFDHPTLEGLSAYLGSGTGMGKVVKEGPKRVERRDRMPLSYSQERLWFIDQLEGSVHYHIPTVLRLQGEVEGRLLEGALRGIVERHEVLRTVIESQEGVPYQRVKGSEGWKLERVKVEGEEALRERIKEMTSRRFDLSADYMLRGMLVEMGEGEGVLVVVVHHIASDGWSSGILVKEFMEYYEALREGRAVRLPELGLQYGDYALWQRQYLSGKVLEGQLSYWHQKLKNYKPLELAADYPRPAVQSLNGGIVKSRLDKRISDRVQTICQQEEVTEYMFLLTVINVLLYRYTGERNIVVGSPVAARDRKEVEGLIGLFTNTVVICNEVDAKQSFTELLRQVRRTTLEAYSHQDAPFEKVVEVVVKQRDRSRSPLFQILFDWRHNNGRSFEADGMEFPADSPDYVVAKFDLTYSIISGSQGLSVLIEYCSDLYRRETIERMMGHYQRLLESVVSCPEEKVGRLGMLSGEEERQLMGEFNATETPYDLSRTVVELFGEQAAWTPEAVAVVYGGQEVSYGELDRRSNQLGQYLRERGVGVGVLVPLCVERSVEMVIGILGILKAGGTYVPIDPEYPAERIGNMLEDIGPEVVVTTGSCRGAIGSVGGLVVELDGDASAIGQAPAAALRAGAGGGDAAYVIYTSGSTGRPKGVVIEHGSLINYLLTGKDRYRSADGQGCMGSFAHLPFTFDASVTGIFLPLLWGKAIVIGAKKGVETFEDENFQRYAPYDFIKLTPGHLSLLEKEMGKGKVLLTKKLVLGGEALQRQHFQYLVDEGLEVELINEYGPTEATVGCCMYRFETQEGQVGSGSHGVWIGQPMDNVQVYILDGQKQLCAIGVEGEVYIGGAGVGRGYLNQPELTAERFVSNEYGEGRLYRTGDKGRWLGDGNIEFLGRVDEQVKIRGYRVEPGEVEEVLKGCPGVGQVVVLAEREGEEVKGLVGYVVATEGYEREEVKGWLLRQLPEYMVPGRLVEVEEIPLTANGKVDRAALGRQGGLLLEGRGYAAPEGALERKMAGIWSELLGVERVGRGDNFFELGGHSLVAIRLVDQIGKELHKEISVSDIFEYPTIQTLTAKWDADQRAKKVLNIKSSRNRHLELLHDNGGQFHVFLIPGNGGRSDVFQPLAGALGSMYTVYGFHMKGTERRGKPLGSIRSVASQNIKWLRQVQPHGPYRLIGYCYGVNIAFEMARQLEKAGEKVDYVVFLDGPAGLYRIHAPDIKESDMVLQMVADYFDRFNILKPPYPDWIHQLRKEVTDLPIMEIMPRIAVVAKEHIPAKTDAIDLLTRLVQVRMVNIQMTYVPKGTVNAELIVMKAEEGKGDQEETMGWQGRSKIIRTLCVPGDHHSMLNEKNSGAIARHLKTMQR